MRQMSLFSVFLLMVVPFLALADNNSNISGASGQKSPTGTQVQSSNPQSSSASQASPADRAYQEKLLQLSDEISKKIAEVQAKQKELDEEIYPASKPPIQADLDALNKQLDELKMQKDKLDSQNTAREMQQKLSAPAGTAGSGGEN